MPTLSEGPRFGDPGSELSGLSEAPRWQCEVAPDVLPAPESTGNPIQRATPHGLAPISDSFLVNEVGYLRWTRREAGIIVRSDEPGLREINDAFS